MKYLHYPLYCRGGSGFSNLVMSAELGVVAAFLLDRVLVIEGNISPPANVVQYRDHGVSNRHQARITDLLELPVAWIDAERVDYDPDTAIALGEGAVMDNVFLWPPDLDRQGEDFRAFARGRKRVVAESAASRSAPVVRLFPSSPDGYNTENLGQYGYFFYLDETARRAVHALLRGVRPHAPYAALVERVAAELGEFNAVHIRRGDFKQTFGTTTLDRRPEEAIRVLERSFGRDETLAILTDEREDPFFEEVTSHFRRSIFVDYYILEHHREAFFELPFHDSIALAYLSQLVAAESKDFVGTMTSTFTNLVQRLRGNRGKVERFKFLWNELPDPGHALETRGSHPPSDCVPLHPDGSPVEEHAGLYSWNRVNPRINPAWQREWPESFLSADEGRALQRALPTSLRGQGEAVGEPCQGGAGTTAVELTLLLASGQSFESELASDSEILRELFQALNARAAAGAGAQRLLQVPTRGGEGALAFPSSQLVAIETRPPVLIEEAFDAAGGPETHPPRAQAGEPRPDSAPAPEPPAAPRLARDSPEPQQRLAGRRGGPIVVDIPARARAAPQLPRDFDPLPYVEVTDFLTPDEQAELLALVLEGESGFAPGDGDPSQLSSVFDPAFAERIANRLCLLLPHVLPRFDLSRTIRAEDLQLVAQRSGYARAGAEGQAAAMSPDAITCSYFFHREPKPLSGGELRLRKGADMHLVEPRNNAMMIFPTAALVQVQPLRCPTGAFGDSRFALTARID